MPTVPVDLGTGTTITFGTSAFASELLSVNWTGISREVVDTTPLSITPAAVGAIGNRRYKAAHAVDPGTLECEFHFNPDDVPPVGGEEESITVTFPLGPGNTTPAKWVCDGVMTNFDVTGIALDSKMVARATIKLTGSIVITEAA